MQADSVWDMIFGWNLRERFGELEYGARHRQNILWFVTGPMSGYFGVSLFPAAAIGALAVLVALWRRTVAHAATLNSIVRLRESRTWAYLASFADEPGNRLRPRETEVQEPPFTGMGILWVVWFGLAVIAFGGANIRLATYWAAATPTVAALTGIGIVAIPSLLAEGRTDQVADICGLGSRIFLLRARLWQSERTH